MGRSITKSMPPKETNSALKKIWQQLAKPTKPSTMKSSAACAMVEIE